MLINQGKRKCAYEISAGTLQLIVTWSSLGWTSRVREERAAAEGRVVTAWFRRVSYWGSSLGIKICPLEVQAMTPKHMVVYSCCCFYLTASYFTKGFCAPLLFLYHPQPCSRQSREQFQSHSQCRRLNLKEGVFEMSSFPEE